MALPGAEARRQRLRYVGVWALVDNANNLFNVRLQPDGRATSTSGSEGTPQAGSGALRPGQVLEQGRWRPWGNGVRIDYADGWTDALLVGPAGAVQWSWAPGADRLQPPGNHHGKAVRVEEPVAAVVGIYRLHPPRQTCLPTPPACSPMAWPSTRSTSGPAGPGASQVARW